MFLRVYNLFRTEMNSGSIAGYFLQAVPVTVVVGMVYSLLRLVFLKRKNRSVSWPSEGMRLLFVCYMTGLCSLVILPANFWLCFFDGVFFGWWEYMCALFKWGEINLIPTVVKCLSGAFSLGSWVKEMLVFNVVMFVPFGFFLPFLTERLNGKRALAVSVIVPLMVELLQLVVGRSFDIDDWICNFLGIMLGLLIAGGIKKVRRSASTVK